MSLKIRGQSKWIKLIPIDAKRLLGAGEQAVKGMSELSLTLIVCVRVGKIDEHLPTIPIVIIRF